MTCSQTLSLTGYRSICGVPFGGTKRHPGSLHEETTQNITVRTQVQKVFAPKVVAPIPHAHYRTLDCTSIHPILLLTEEAKILLYSYKFGPSRKCHIPTKLRFTL